MKKNYQTMSYNEKLTYLATNDFDTIRQELKTTSQGMHAIGVEKNRERFGNNVIRVDTKPSIIKQLIKAFINPFTIILIMLAIVSYFTDVYFQPKGEEDFITVIIIAVMVTVSGLLRFIQEYRSNSAADKLKKMVQVTTSVQRRGGTFIEIPVDDVVVGDLIKLSAGDLIPADMRIIEAKDLFITQSALTGESEHVEKYAHSAIKLDDAITSTRNLAFMGSDVVSGTAIGVVGVVGMSSLFGSISSTLNEKAPETRFELGVKNVSWLLIRFMTIMVPIVFLINAIGKGNWFEALLFAVSIAVGLTPEMLPMIVTTSLAKGAVHMSKKKTIVKSLNAIQDLGAIDILCTDKTGTLTQDKVVLEYHLDPLGNEASRVLKHAFLNSYHQTGLKNLLDKSVIERTDVLSESDKSLQNLKYSYNKIDEIPFDFTRRRMSVVVKDQDKKIQMITKGAVEEMVNICSFVEFEGEVVPITEEVIARVLQTSITMNEKGFRMIAVAQKTLIDANYEFSVKDEQDMVLLGYLAFLDPPKEDAKETLDNLKEYGVTTKILTGDNDLVTRSLCNMIGMDVERIVLGSEIDTMTDADLAGILENNDVFAKLTPFHKQRIVRVLRESNHAVGFLGDGINDAPAMRSADVGISVDNAVDIAKESSEVILLEKNLSVLEDGIIEGRKTYANMIKYIKMTASSNFGNVFSVLVASFFLPFIPMEAIHLILLNLIYDLSCIAIPWDNVDEEFLKVPRKWDASSIRNFMLIIGPTSSLFDITTYLLMFFVLAPQIVGMPYHQITDPAVKVAFVAIFQAGWFVESMWSQTLVIHMIRTEKIPFIQSRASLGLTLLTFTGIGVLTYIPFTTFGAYIGLAPLPMNYFGWLAVTILAYMILATIAKRYFIRRYGELL